MKNKVSVIIQEIMATLSSVAKAKSIAIDKTQFRLTSMLLISTMDDLEILYQRKQ